MQADNTLNILIATAGQDEKWAKAAADRLPKANIFTSHQNYDPNIVDYVLLWNQPPDLIGRLPNLKAIFSLGAGVDHVLSSPGLSADTPIIRLEDAGMVDQMVQYHLYAALHFMRDFDVYAAQQAKANWLTHDISRISQYRVGVMGLGVMGTAVAVALANLGFTVSGWSRSIKVMDGITTYAGKESLSAFLGQTDILICLLPRTTETERILNAANLASLPKGAAVINAARGTMMVAEDLLRLLDSGHLRGAFLDVADFEPLPANHPFWRHRSIRLTPHIAAVSRIEESVDQIADNLDRLARNQVPRGLVDHQSGY